MKLRRWTFHLVSWKAVQIAKPTRGCVFVLACFMVQMQINGSCSHISFQAKGSHFGFSQLTHVRIQCPQHQIGFTCWIGRVELIWPSCRAGGSIHGEQRWSRAACGLVEHGVHPVVCLPVPQNLSLPRPGTEAFRASDGGSQTSSLYFSTVIFPLEIAIETKNKYEEPEQTNPSAF